jgi:hypothetical protein
MPWPVEKRLPQNTPPKRHHLRQQKRQHLHHHLHHHTAQLGDGPAGLADTGRGGSFEIAPSSR